MMWQKVGVEKEAAELRSALADIEHFRRNLLPRMGLKRTASSLNYEWLDAIDVVNMIDACELIILSSLEARKVAARSCGAIFPKRIMRLGWQQM